MTHYPAQVTYTDLPINSYRRRVILWAKLDSVEMTLLFTYSVWIYYGRNFDTIVKYSKIRINWYKFMQGLAPAMKLK